MGLRVRAVLDFVDGYGYWMLGVGYWMLDVFTMILAKYAKVFDIGLQNTFVYRWNFLLRAVFGIVPLIGTVFVWQAIFHTRGAAINGYDYSAMIFYFMLTVFLENLITPT